MQMTDPEEIEVEVERETRLDISMEKQGVRGCVYILLSPSSSAGLRAGRGGGYPRLHVRKTRIRR
jgi:hypothetical protein